MLKWTLLIVRSHRHGQVVDLPRLLALQTCGSLDTSQLTGRIRQ